MKHIRKMKDKEHIVDYAKNLATYLFEGVTRDAGLSYTDEHLAKVASLVEDVTIQSPYRDSAIAAGWLHDSVEDIDQFETRPLESGRRHQGVTYLSDLVSNAGKDGERTCFMVNLMTHREGVIYPDYFYNIFNLPPNTEERNLHILTGIVKVSDMRSNINPYESKNFNDLLDKYMGMKDATEEEREEFYKKTKTIDAFRKKGSLDLDLELFTRCLTDGFQQKKRVTAINNLSYNLPVAEQRLLIDVGKDNGIFDWEKVRALLKDAFLDSLRLYPGDLHEVRKLGVNRSAPKVPGYTNIMKELRQEITDGKYELKLSFAPLRIKSLCHGVELED
jgi:hypothetical protein